jgi:hypothetical protein
MTSLMTSQAFAPSFDPFNVCRIDSRGLSCWDAVAMSNSWYVKLVTSLFDDDFDDVTEMITLLVTSPVSACSFYPFKLHKTKESALIHELRCACLT